AEIPAHGARSERSGVGASQSRSRIAEVQGRQAGSHSGLYRRTREEAGAATGAASSAAGYTRSGTAAGPPARRQRSHGRAESPDCPAASGRASSGSRLAATVAPPSRLLAAHLVCQARTLGPADRAHDTAADHHARAALSATVQ